MTSNVGRACSEVNRSPLTIPCRRRLVRASFRFLFCMMELLVDAALETRSLLAERLAPLQIAVSPWSSSTQQLLNLTERSASVVEQENPVK